MLDVLQSRIFKQIKERQGRGRRRRKAERKGLVANVFIMERVFIEKEGEKDLQGSEHVLIRKAKSRGKLACQVLWEVLCAGHTEGLQTEIRIFNKLHRHYLSRQQPVLMGKPKYKVKKTTHCGSSPGLL